MIEGMKEYREEPDFLKRVTPVITLGYLLPVKIFDDELIPDDKTSNKNIIYSGYWLKIENELHYFKVPMSNLCMLRELLGVKVSKYFNLPTVEYKIAEAAYLMNDEVTSFYGVLSKWARKEDCSYTTLENLEKKYFADLKNIKNSSNNCLATLELIDELYKNNPITKQLRTFIIRDFFTQEKGRLTSEVLIENNNDEISLGKLMDYEESWENIVNKNYFISQFLDFNPEENACVEMIRKDDIMQEALVKLMDINIIKLLEEVRDEHNIRLIDYDKDYFDNKSKIIKRYIKEKKLIK